MNEPKPEPEVHTLRDIFLLQLKKMVEGSMEKTMDDRFNAYLKSDEWNALFMNSSNDKEFSAILNEKDEAQSKALFRLLWLDFLKSFTYHLANTIEQDIASARLATQGPPPY